MLPKLRQQCPDRPGEDLEKQIESYGDGKVEELMFEDFGQKGFMAFH